MNLTATLKSNSNGNRVIHAKCKICSGKHEIEVTKDQFEKLTQGQMSIQSILPRLNPGLRELLISGLCSSCFDEIMQ